MLFQLFGSKFKNFENRFCDVITRELYLIIRQIYEMFYLLERQTRDKLKKRPFVTTLQAMLQGWMHYIQCANFLFISDL